MKEYQEVEMQIISFALQDVITSSPNENADDLGNWNGDWFPSNGQ